MTNGSRPTTATTCASCGRPWSPRGVDETCRYCGAGPSAELTNVAEPSDRFLPRCAAGCGARVEWNDETCDACLDSDRQKPTTLDACPAYTRAAA